MVPDMAEDRGTALIRTFLAIPLDTATLNLIESIQQQLTPDLPDIRWVRSINLHLTLCFFGNISEENLEKAADIMVSIGSLFAPFSLALMKIGAHPSTGRARVVWIEVQSARLGELHHALQAQLHAAGFPIERRPFRPHITIGRSRKGTRHILSLQHNMVAETMRVDELILFESRLQPTGVEHLPRHTIRLAESERQKLS